MDEGGRVVGLAEATVAEAQAPAELTAEQLQEQLAALVRQGDSPGLLMGDLLVRLLQVLEVERHVFLRCLPAEAHRLGVGHAALRQRFWVAERFPPGHAVRNHGLSYAHLRALASQPVDAIVMDWAQQAVDHPKQRWSVLELKARIRRGTAPTPTATEASAPPKGDAEFPANCGVNPAAATTLVASTNVERTPCAACRAPLGSSGTAVHVKIGQHAPTLYCGTACAARALASLVTPAKDPQ